MISSNICLGDVCKLFFFMISPVYYCPFQIEIFMKEASTMYAVRNPDIVTIYGTICDTEKVREGKGHKRLY